MASFVSHWLSPRRTVVLLLVAATTLILLYLSAISDAAPYSSVSSLWNSTATADNEEEPEPENPTVAIVVPKQTHENTTWIEQSFPEWTKYIYEVDDRHAPLTISLNKGREAMTYLTYIIDHYDRLDNITIFHHADRYQWHTDHPTYDSLDLLSRLNLTHVQERGYQNLRCAWKPGCDPDALYLLPASAYRRRSLETNGGYNADLIERQHETGNQSLSQPQPNNSPNSGGTLTTSRHPVVTVPRADPAADAVLRENAYSAFAGLFGTLNVPELVQAPCCAEFAVTAKTIRRREKPEYVHWLRWIKKPENNDITVTLLERFWHVIFGHGAVDCPKAPECYCKLYGLCDLKCETDGFCSSQWQAPESKLDSQRP